MTNQLHEQTTYWRVPEYNMELLDATFTQHQFPLHFHEDYVIAVVDQGYHRFYLNGSVREIEKGDILLINPGEVHGCYDMHEAGWKYRCFYPGVTLIRQIANEITGKDWEMPAFATPVLEDSALTQQLSVLHTAMEHSRTRLVKDTLLREAMGLLIRRYADNQPNGLALSRDNRAVAQAQAYLQAHYAEDVSLDDLAAAVGLSPYHLSRIFKDHVGLPPHKYLIQIRVQRAKTLLSGGSSIVDAAIDVGFADQSHLTRWFKRVVGVPPGQFI